MFRLNIIKMVLIAIMMFIPATSFAGIGLSGQNRPVTTDTVSMQLTSYYDLRERQSFVQVSNVSNAAVAIHVQIFQNDLLDCPELNFYDTLTPNDTHIYNMDVLAGNALPVNIDIGDDSNGFVVITQVESSTPGSDSVGFDEASLIGNFRIVDATGYEYRTNSAGFSAPSQVNQFNVRYTINYNQIGGNNQSDIVGISFFNGGPGFASVNERATSFETFVLNNAESATSCDITVFACGGDFFSQISNTSETDLLNLGINDVFPSTNGENLICAGNQDTSGFVDFIGEDEFVTLMGSFFAGYAGLNNGDGRGSMDSWVGNDADICQFFPNGDCPLALGGILGDG